MSKLIYNPKEKLYWSNKDGWVDRSSATRFTEAQVRNIPWLPGTGSKWVKTGLSRKAGRKTK